MAVYTYQAIDPRGRRICGHRQVADYEEIKNYLERKGLTEAKIYATRTRYSGKPYKYTPPQELSALCRRMSALIRSGESIEGAILSVSERTANAQLRTALSEIRTIMGKGFSIAEAVGMYSHVLTKTMANTINIGEGSGNLEGAFTSLADWFAKEARMRERVRAALIYPVTLFGGMTALLIAVLTVVLPAFNDAAASIPGFSADNTLFGGAPFDAAIFLSWVMMAVIALLVTVGFGLFLFIRTRKGKVITDKIKTRLPFAGKVVINADSARFLRGVSLLAEGGVAVGRAIEDARTLITNRYLAEVFGGAVRRLRQGVELDKVLDELEPFPPLFINTVYYAYVTEDARLIAGAADEFEERAETTIDLFERLFEPAVVTVAAVILSAILVVVARPMVNLLSSL
jgi:type II secretory pathway component PulF